MLDWARKLASGSLGVLRRAGAVAKRSRLQLECLLGSVASSFLGDPEHSSITTLLCVECSVAGSQGVFLFLLAELGQPDLIALLVTEIHRLAQLALGCNAVKDKGIESNGQEFKTNLNKSAEKRPVNLSANKGVINVILEEDLAHIVFTRPTPKIFTSASCFCRVQYTGNGSPHSDSNDEGSNSSDSPVDSEFFSPVMTSAPVCKENST